MSHIRPGVLTLAFMASLLLWANIAVTPATAALVMFNFNGNVTSDGTGGQFPFNTTVSGLFQFKDNPSPATGGAYPGVVSDLSLGFSNGYTSVLTPGANAVSVLKNIDLTGNGTIFGDRWRLVSEVTSRSAR